MMASTFRLPSTRTALALLPAAESRAATRRGSCPLPPGSNEARRLHGPRPGYGARRHASTSMQKRPKTALFFPGHGVQRVGMTTPWVEAFPHTCKPFLEEMDAVLETPLSKIIAEGPNSKLNSTEHAQPAIMATSIMALRVLEREFGFDTNNKIDVVLGHSLGEFAAIVAGGYLDYRDSLRIIRRRAEAMQRCTKEASQRSNGSEFGMVALVCEPGRLAPLIGTIEEFLEYAPFPAAGSDVLLEDAEDDALQQARDTGGGTGSGSAIPAIQQVMIANVNSKNQIVLSGEIRRINELLNHLRQFGGHDPRAVRLNADSPFHSPIMYEAKAVMQRLMARSKVDFPGRFPCVSNVSARPFESADDLRDLLARQCVETVRWWDSIRYVDQDMGVRRWVGIGPGKVGRNLVGKEVGMRGGDVVRGGGVWAISRPEEIEDFLKGFEASESADEDS